MKKALILLTFLFIIPQSFAQSSKTVVASINTSYSSKTSQADRVNNRNFFDPNEIHNLELMYENTYDFIKTRYSYYKQLDILNTDFSKIGNIKDSVTFLGAILPFVTLPDNNDESGSLLSENGLSFVFFYKRKF